MGRELSQPAYITMIFIIPNRSVNILVISKKKKTKNWWSNFFNPSEEHVFCSSLKSTASIFLWFLVHISKFMFRQSSWNDSETLFGLHLNKLYFEVVSRIHLLSGVSKRGTNHAINFLMSHDPRGFFGWLLSKLFHEGSISSPSIRDRELLLSYHP